jgi:hypothetical protein
MPPRAGRQGAEDARLVPAPAREKDAPGGLQGTIEENKSGGEESHRIG